MDCSKSNLLSFLFFVLVIKVVIMANNNGKSHQGSISERGYSINSELMHWDLRETQDFPLQKVGSAKL